MTDHATKFNPLWVLDLEMEENDAEASTVREYLTRLLRLVWLEDEGFNGKRPFGNSGWKTELHWALIRNGVSEDEDLDGIILAAIEEMGR